MGDPVRRAAIVCGVDHSEGSRGALRVAADLAERLDSRLLLVNVRRSPADVPPGMASESDVVRERAVAGGRRLLEELGAEFLDESHARRLLELVVGRVEFGDPASRLARVADEVRATLIVVGSRGRGRTGSLLLGSVSQTVSSAPSRPVLVVPPEAGTETHRHGARGGRPPSIVCGVDGSDHAANAVRIAARLASALGVRLVLAHVEPDGDEAPPASIDLDARLRAGTRSRLRILQRAMDAVGDTEVEGSLVRGEPAASLRELAASESAEMIAVGTRGHGALKALVLKVFDLELEQGVSELLPGRKTETWGANGSHLAPTLRASRGDEVMPRVSNRLGAETTTIHWHGMHLPAAADGGPHQTIAPGETWSPGWTIDQPAATLWYHPHPHPETEDQVYRGLVGMFILDDPNAAELALPRKYGVDDIPLIIQDKKLEEDGSLDFSNAPISPTGRLGDEILVNGTHDPHLEVSAERVRLRLLNASGARIYNIGFADDREFDLIATEGGLLEAPRAMERIQLSPGERAEIVVELEPGEEVVLRSYEPDLGTNFFEGRFAGGDDSFDLLEIRAADELAPAPELPERLVTQEPPSDSEPAEIRRFELSGQGSINGRSMDMTRIDEVVELGTTEVWEVKNASGTPHNFHPHDVRFRVVEYAGGPPPAHLQGLKDTVYVPPGETVRLVTEFHDYTDAELPYMFHCHVLQHEDRGMMGQYTVVDR